MRRTLVSPWLAWPPVITPTIRKSRVRTTRLSGRTTTARRKTLHDRDGEPPTQAPTWHLTPVRRASRIVADRIVLDGNRGHRRIQRHAELSGSIPVAYYSMNAKSPS